VDVTPLSVVLRRGDQRYTLPLGGPKTPPAPAAGSPAPVTPMAAQQPLRPTALPAPAPMQAPLPDPTRPDIPVVGHVNVMTLCRTFRTPDSRQELDQDVANFRQAVKQVPNLAPTHVILGFLCGQAGLLDEAVKNYRIGIRLAAGYSSLAPKPLALAHSGLGIALADQGHVDAALRECRIAVQMDPNTASNHNDLAEVLDYKHLPAQAIAECRRAMALKPDRKIEAAIANNLGLAYQDQNRLTDAATQFNKAIQLNPQDATVHSNLGCLLLALGNTDGAIAELREAVRLDPDNTKARKNLTDALALTGTSS
jgi:tetratricopeptide (TPR) repeat protein